MKIEQGTKLYNFLYFISKWGHGYNHPNNIRNAFPTTVCQAIWFIVYGLSGLAMRSILISIFVVFVAFMMAIALTHTVYPITGYSIFPLLESGIKSFISIMFWVIIGAITLIEYQKSDHCRKSKKISEYFTTSKKVDTPNNNEPQSDGIIVLLFEYAKSFKNKVCPTIEYDHDINEKPKAPPSRYMKENDDTRKEK